MLLVTLKFSGREENPTLQGRISAFSINLHNQIKRFIIHDNIRYRWLVIEDTGTASHKPKI